MQENGLYRRFHPKKEHISVDEEPHFLIIEGRPSARFAFLDHLKKLGARYLIAYYYNDDRSLVQKHWCYAKQELSRNDVFVVLSDRYVSWKLHHLQIRVHVPSVEADEYVRLITSNLSKKLD
jgi:hypothetical protein